MAKGKHISYDMNSKINDLNNKNHPYRVMANRIIDEVVEFNIEESIPNYKKERMVDDIVALLSNLE